MPTYHTGSVRYHVSEFLSDRHPYNPATGSDTQRQREAGLVKNSHESIAFEKLQEDLVAMDDPNEKVKALRALLAHASSAENKVALLRKGLVPRLAATLMQSRKRSIEAGKALNTSEAEMEAATTQSAAEVGGSKDVAPHIQQLTPFKVTGGSQQAWAAVETASAQLFRSLCVIPQGVHCVIEEGGWTALVASVADSTNGLKDRESARVCAATAISLLTSTGAALNWLSTGSIDGPSDLQLQGYTCSEAFYAELAYLYNNKSAASEAGQAAAPPAKSSRKSSSASTTSTPDMIGTQPLESIDNRELILSAFFDTAVVALTKEQSSPKLLVSILDSVGNLIALERSLHLALISGILRALSSYIGNVLLKDDLWLHTAGAAGTAGTVIASADPKTATPASAAEAHKHPGTAPVSNSGTKLINGPQIDISSKIANILWHIGLDSVGKQEVRELYQIVFQTGKLLQLLIKETTPVQLLSLKALVAGALGSMALLPEMKKLMTGKKDFPVEIQPSEDGTVILNGNKDANGLDRSFVDTLLELLRNANGLMRERFPHVVSTSAGGSSDNASEGKRLSVADTAVKRDLDAVITNTVATLRLISELPATRTYLHTQVFHTNSPPVNIDGPALTIAAAQEGKEHELRRQLFYSTRWEKEFKVYVY